LVARDLGRFPSEICAIGRAGFRVVLRARGWLGRLLEFEGAIIDARPPVESGELQDMLALYYLEKDEREEIERRAGG
jgi:hypothetical protein